MAAASGAIFDQIILLPVNKNIFGCCTSLKSEFKVHNLGLNYYRREAFYLPQWHWPPLVFILYRLAVSGYTLAWLIYTGFQLAVVVINGQHYPWPVWLTNWTYLMLTVHLLLSAIIAIIHTVSEGEGCCKGHRIRRRLVSQNASSGSETYGPETSGGMATSNSFGPVEIIVPISLPWYMKLNWLIYNVVAVFAFLVTIIYFAALYPMIARQYKVNFGPSIIDINLHAINSVIMFLEILVNGIPIRILHVLYPLIYGAVYVIFSAIYWSVDHRNVLYPGVLDWNKPGTTIVIMLILAFVVIPLFQLLLFLAYKLKVFIYGKIYSV